MKMAHLNIIKNNFHGKIGSNRRSRSIAVSLIIFSTLATAILYATIDRRDEKALAIIGNRIIDQEYFLARYKKLRSKINVPDNGQSRKEIFNSILDEESLIAEAEERGYDKDAYGRSEYDKIQTQELLDEFHRQFVSNGIEVSDDELRKLFVRFNTKIKARHLYAPTYRQADSLYKELFHGKSFEELAKENFEDPRLRDTGGALGYFTVDEMDPFFEDAAFALDVGQISKPIRTAQGYSIIQVQERMTKPLLTDSEFAKRRPNLEQYWRQRKMKSATRSFVDSLRQDLDVEFQRPVVVELLRSIKNRPPVPAEAEDSYYLPGDERLDRREVVRSRLGAWEVRSFREHAKLTSETHLKWVQNEESLEEFIAGLVVRDYMLSTAKDLELHKTEAYRENVKQKMDDYLLKRIEERITDSITIPEDTLRNYFRHNKDQFQIPPKIYLSELVLNDEAIAVEIKDQLVKNIPFEKLANDYSVQRRSAVNGGDIGLFSYQELGSYAERIFPLNVGKWIGPIKIDSQYAFFKCLGKDAERAPSFDEARSEIEKSLKPIWRKKARQDVLQDIRKHVKVVAYPEKLNSIQLN